MRRLSVASLDSGAESPVYGEEPSASADRGPAEMPTRADGHGRWAAGGRPGGGRRRAGMGGSAGLAVRSASAASLRFRFRAASDTRQHGAVGLVTPGQVGTGVPRLATTCDMSVVDRQSGRWYVKDIRASTQPMGTQ